MQARVLLFNRFACFWLKGYQLGSLGNSHQNGDYLKQAMRKIVFTQESNLQPSGLFSFVFVIWLFREGPSNKQTPEVRTGHVWTCPSFIGSQKSGAAAKLVHSKILLSARKMHFMNCYDARKRNKHFEVRSLLVIRI